MLEDPAGYRSDSVAADDRRPMTPIVGRDASIPQRIWILLKSVWSGYSADDCLTRGAAIAYYSVFSLAPVLVIVIAVAGMVFGEDAARGAIVEQMTGLMGRQGAEAIQAMINGASHRNAGWLATTIGLLTLVITASGVFSEMQSALNVIWKAEPSRGGVSGMFQARLTGLGLVLALGFLLLASLVVSTAIAALDAWFAGILPGWHQLLQGVSFLVSFLLIAAMFGAIYKILPNKAISWTDVAVGAVVTSLLFSAGKHLISLYLGQSSTASTFGAASTLAVMLLWIYYSSQLFLLGAEFTRAFAQTFGTHAPSVQQEKVKAT